MVGVRGAKPKSGLAWRCRSVVATSGVLREQPRSRWPWWSARTGWGVMKARQSTVRTYSRTRAVRWTLRLLPIFRQALPRRRASVRFSEHDTLTRGDRRIDGPPETSFPAFVRRGIAGWQRQQANVQLDRRLRRWTRSRVRGMLLSSSWLRNRDWGGWRSAVSGLVSDRHPGTVDLG